MAVQIVRFVALSTSRFVDSSTKCTVCRPVDIALRGWQYKMYGCVALSTSRFVDGSTKCTIVALLTPRGWLSGLFWRGYVVLLDIMLFHSEMLILNRPVDYHSFAVYYSH